MRTQILLADDHELFLSGLSALLQQHSGLEVVATVHDGRAAVQEAEKANPDIAILDVSMPLLNGVEATRRICKQTPTVKVLCLSMHRDKTFVLSALEAGASGYLLKESALEEVLQAIRCLQANQMYLSPAISSVVVDAYLCVAQDTPQTLLTDREREVLQCIAEGYATKEIATQLHISVKTIQTHREHLMEKLDLHSIAALTKYALKKGLTSFDV